MSDTTLNIESRQSTESRPSNGPVSRTSPSEPIRSEKLGKILKRFRGYIMRCGMDLEKDPSKEEKIITSSPIVDIRWDPKRKEIILILSSSTTDYGSLEKIIKPSTGQILSLAKKEERRFL
jgi:hypothetical protein